MEQISAVILTGLVIAVSIFDLRERRIPNFLVFPAAFVGLGLNACLGWEGLFFGMKGLALGFALLFVPYLIGAYKPGDVKLLAAIGAFVGPTGVFRVILATFLCYPLLAAFFMIRQRKVDITLLRFRRVFFNFLGYFLPAFKLYAMRVEARDDQTIASATTPFSVSIALGTLVALYTTFLR
jgi:prepilin peptidase CpaA